MLEEVLGPNKAIARISTEIDFQQIDITEEKYDPNTVLRSEQKNTERSSAVAGGMLTGEGKIENPIDQKSPKSKTNSIQEPLKPLVNTSPPLNTNSSERQHEIRNYEISNINKHIKSPIGNIMKMSAAVVVDGTYKEGTEPKGSKTKKYSPRSPDEMKGLENIVKKAMEGGKAQSIIEGIQEEGKWNLFQKIRRLDPKTIANFIKHEHPQTIAIILIHLDTAQTAAILEELPGPLQTDVIHRIAELENVPQGIVEEIDQALQEEIAMIKSSEGQQKGGVRLVAEILNQMDSSVEGKILKGIEEQKQGLAEEIRKLMFVFEDLIQVNDQSIMAILKEVNNETLMMAMKTASDELKEKLFKNMSERAAQMMKEDLEVMGPARLKDVEAAQQAILKIAKKLEGEGKIVLVSKGKEEVFV
jgi:flagellar motor switch protein FliG